VVEASRLERPTPLLKTDWIKKGALVVPYGTMSAVELSLTDIMDKVVVDDWGQCRSGMFGSLRAHVDAGKLTEKTVYAELGEIVAGRKPGRESDEETNLFWHRGLSISDIALGHAMGKSEAAASASFASPDFGERCMRSIVITVSFLLLGTAMVWP
jgi:ornithine cyclodeaminase